jgi:hypothetical protein
MCTVWIRSLDVLESNIIPSQLSWLSKTAATRLHMNVMFNRMSQRVLFDTRINILCVLQSKICMK